MGTTCGERFYAIYYTTEFKYIGRGDAFIAPKAGTYTFKLWGSPGGTANPDRAAGNGGFTQIAIKLIKNEKIYAFVGCAGKGITDKAVAGGYNGGGGTTLCTVAKHSGSGGGATHISYAYNPIISDVIIIYDNAKKDNDYGNEEYSLDCPVVHCGNKDKDMSRKDYVLSEIKKHNYWGKYIKDDQIIEHGEYDFGRPSDYCQPVYVVKCHTWTDTDKVIAVAGGGGGGNGANNGWGSDLYHNVNGAQWGFGGGETGGNMPVIGSKRYPALSIYGNMIPSSDNAKKFGYSQGAGQYAYESSGAGGGWYGGYSVMMTNKPNGCGSGGAGGTGYIKNLSTIIRESSFTKQGLESFGKPYTEGTNGYITVSN